MLAHLCGGVGGFARAFEADADVHRLTASEIFDVAEDEVTSEMRSTAKAINFGLVYGQTDFGLAQALRISRGEARDYIERYKERYPEIDQYMERFYGVTYTVDPKTGEKKQKTVKPYNEHHRHNIFQYFIIFGWGGSTFLKCKKMLQKI